MNPFEEKSLVEARALKVLLPFLDFNSEGGHAVRINKGPIARSLQEKVGDVILNHRADGGLLSVEIKAEERFTGNLFLETYSNKNFERSRWGSAPGSNVGWLQKSIADLLMYYFLDNDMLIIVLLEALQMWAFEWQRPNLLVGRIYGFAEKEQRKTKQRNRTTGHCVPIDVLEEEVGVTRISGLGRLLKRE